MKKCATIIANGEYPSSKHQLDAIENANFIVCCDGAANGFIERGGLPDAIVGDCDSISEDNKQMYANIIHHVKSQEDNDLTKSVNFCLQNGFSQITIVAATGKREDHALANISLLFDYVDLVSVKMITNYGIFTPINKTTVFKSFTGEKVSIFSIDKKPITTRGLQYEVKNRIFTNLWQGTLNKCVKDDFEIAVSGKVVVFQVFE